MFRNFFRWLGGFFRRAILDPINKTASVPDPVVPDPDILIPDPVVVVPPPSPDEPVESPVEIEQGPGVGPPESYNESTDLGDLLDEEGNPR